MRGIPRWKRVELKVLEILRQHFKSVFYQHPLMIRDEETKRIFIHHIDFVIRTDDEYAVELDGEIHFRSARQRSKTEWRNNAIKNAGYKLIVIDCFEYDYDAERIAREIVRRIKGDVGR